MAMLRRVSQELLQVLAHELGLSASQMLESTGHLSLSTVRTSMVRAQLERIAKKEFIDHRIKTGEIDVQRQNAIVSETFYFAANLMGFRPYIGP